MNKTFKHERQKFKHLVLQYCYADHDEFFTQDSHHNWAFVGGSTTSPNKSKMADDAHILHHNSSYLH